jgi:hypothetical protein
MGVLYGYAEQMRAHDAPYVNTGTPLNPPAHRCRRTHFGRVRIWQRQHHPDAFRENQHSQQ